MRGIIIIIIIISSIISIIINMTEQLSFLFEYKKKSTYNNLLRCAAWPA